MIEVAYGYLTQEEVEHWAYYIFDVDGEGYKNSKIKELINTLTLRDYQNIAKTIGKGSTNKNDLTEYAVFDSVRIYLKNLWKDKFNESDKERESERL